MKTSYNVAHPLAFQRWREPTYSIPGPLMIADIVGEIFKSLSFQDLFNFELTCQDMYQATRLVWPVFQEKKGFLYKWSSLSFQSDLSHQEKKNYFLSQALENFIRILPENNQKMQERLESLGTRFPLFQSFMKDMRAVACGDLLVKISGQRHSYPSAAPRNQYQEELILHTISKIFDFFKLTCYTSGFRDLPERPPLALQILTSQAISAGATFITRLSITLLKNNITSGNQADRFLPFVMKLARQTYAKGDISGQKLLTEYIEKHSKVMAYNQEFKEITRNNLPIRRNYYLQNLNEQEKLFLNDVLSKIKEDLENSHLTDKKIYGLFKLFAEVEAHEMVDYCLSKIRNLNILQPGFILIAIERKMKLKEFMKANYFYDILFSRPNLFSSNITQLNAMALLKFQLGDYEKANTYLMQYWNNNEWHSFICLTANNHKWVMDKLDAFKNEEFQILIACTIEIKEKLNDQQGAEWFKNLFQLIHLNLEDHQACVITYEGWKRDDFCRKAKEDQSLSYPLLCKMDLLINKFN